MIYKTGSNVKLIHKAELCKSIIADGKELIVTGKESGELRVPELKDEKVYITFKEKVTNFYFTFYGCSALKSIPENLFANYPEVTAFTATFLRCDGLAEIPENLFANNPKVTDFYGTFENCEALKSIPENLFANCPKVTSFQDTFQDCSALTSIPENLFANNLEITSFNGTFYGCTSLTNIPTGLFDNNRKVTSWGSDYDDMSGTFKGCSALTGESPYTMIDGQKVHLYERADYPEHFTTPTSTYQAFGNCTGLTDYAQIPSDWK